MIKPQTMISGFKHPTNLASSEPTSMRLFRNLSRVVRVHVTEMQFCQINQLVMIRALNDKQVALEIMTRVL